MRKPIAIAIRLYCFAPLGSWLGKIKSNVGCFVNHLICTCSAPVKSRQSESFFYIFFIPPVLRVRDRKPRLGENPRPVRPPSRLSGIPSRSDSDPIPHIYFYYPSASCPLPRIPKNRMRCTLGSIDLSNSNREWEIPKSKKELRCVVYAG